jgi:hypothetical protein
LSLLVCSEAMWFCDTASSPGCIVVFFHFFQVCYQHTCPLQDLERIALSIYVLSFDDLQAVSP